MVVIKNEELELLNGDKSIRNKYIDRVYILDKVKELNCLPNTVYSTTSQVASYFETTQDNIRQTYKRFIEEFAEDGASHFKYGEIKKLINSDNLSQLGISPNGSVVYPKRSLLRFGMLLRDNVIAQEIRNLLLNVYDDVSQGKDNIIQNINNEYTLEQEIQMRMGIAIMNGDIDAFAIASTEMAQLKNQRIIKLEDTIDLLNQNTLTITDSRNAINAIVRKIASIKYYNKFGVAWSEFYKMLNYKANINVKNRTGHTSKLDTLNDSELEEALIIAKNWATHLGLNVNEILSLYSSANNK